MPMPDYQTGMRPLLNFAEEGLEHTDRSSLTGDEREHLVPPVLEQKTAGLQGEIVGEENR